MVSEMKKLVSLSWWFGFDFFEDPALLLSQLPSMKSNIKCQLTKILEISASLSFFTSRNSGQHHNRLEWRVTSGPSPPTMAWHRGIGRKSSKDGHLLDHLKNVNLSKIILFPQCWRKICKELFRKNIQDKLICEKTITKILVFEISHHIIHHLSKSTTQPKFSAYLHLSPQWCRTSILTPHRHRLFATFLRSLEKSCAWLVILQVISFSCCYFLLDGSWAE